MFGLGHAPELILVLALALIVLGPGKIPEVAQFLGKAIRELRQASSDLQKTFDVNELMNPAPPPPAPPPVEAAPPTPAASTETILPPVPEPAPAAAAAAEAAAAETPAKPRRTRKRAAAAPNGAEADAAGSQPLAGSEIADAEPAAVHSNGTEPPNGANAAKPRTRRRPSKKAAEPVSLDATA